MNRKISLAFFVVAIILFLLPWANLSCSGATVATFSGLDMVTGKTYNNPSAFGSTPSNHAGSEPLAVAALAVGVAGAASALVWKRAAVARVVLGVAGVVLLVALKIKLDGDVSREGQGVIQITYQFWYWLTLIMFAAAAGANFLKKRIATGLSPASETESADGVEQSTRQNGDDL